MTAIKKKEQHDNRGVWGGSRHNEQLRCDFSEQCGGGDCTYLYGQSDSAILGGLSSRDGREADRGGGQEPGGVESGQYYF